MGQQWRDLELTQEPDFGSGYLREYGLGSGQEVPTGKEAAYARAIR